MQRALTAIVAVALLALVQAQLPPVGTGYSCTNSTPLATTAFCSSVVNYPIQQSVNVGTADNNAYALYNTTFATINTTAAGCPAALKTYICQNAFQKCSKAQLSTGVGQAVCTDAGTQCGVSSFPGTLSGLTGCIANAAKSVGGTATICAPSSKATGLNQPCRTYTTLIDNNFSGQQSLIDCPSVSGCNNNSICIRPSNLGDACSVNADCVNGNGLLASSLTCIGNQCQYSGKRHGYNCTVNAECLSSNCVNLKCLEYAVDQNCNTTLQCQKGLYCESSTGKCANIALGDNACGQVLSNSYIPCKAGFTCVNGTAGAVKGICTKNAVVGEKCSNQTGVLAYSDPLCSLPSIPVNGSAMCVAGTCQQFSGNQGEICDAVRPCRLDLTCQYPAGQTTGTCQTASSVQCSTDGSLQGCNGYQTCSCASTSTPGTCQVNTNGGYQCNVQRVALMNCLQNNCGSVSDPFYPYDGYSCASASCTAAQTDYYCCLSKYEPNFVAPNNAPSPLCQATTTAPTTAAPATTTGAPGTTSVPTTTKSGAIQNVVSFVALLVFIAFAL